MSYEYMNNSKQCKLFQHKYINAYNKKKFFTDPFS